MNDEVRKHLETCVREERGCVLKSFEVEAVLDAIVALECEVATLTAAAFPEKKGGES